MNTRSVYLAAGKPRVLGAWKPSRRAYGAILPETDTALPASVDLRDRCPPVMDQADIGSCVANACCEALEFLQRKGEGDALYSRLYLYYWARVASGVDVHNDSGLEIPVAIDALQQRGVPLESTWPYEPASARFMLQPPQEADDEAAHHRSVLAYRCPNLMTIKASLAQGFPLVMGLELPSGFMGAETARTGIVMYPSGAEGFAGGHSMLCVGYSDMMQCGPDVGALLLRNSWSTGWGFEGGHAWLPYRFVTSGIASDFTTIRLATS